MFLSVFQFPCYSMESVAFFHFFINFPYHSVEFFFHQFSILFNGNLCIYLANFPCYSIRTLCFSIISFQFSMSCNGAMVFPNPIGQESLCVLQDIVHFRAAALLTITYNHQYTEQGNGYRLPHIALGRLVDDKAQLSIWCNDHRHFTVPFSPRLSHPSLVHLYPS